MVGDINFPKGLPPVSATGRVGRVKRKKRDEDKPPFEQLLDPEDQKGKKKKKDKKGAAKDEPAVTTKTGPLDKSSSLSDSSNPDEAEADSEKKIIDVRV